MRSREQFIRRPYPNTPLPEGGGIGKKTYELKVGGKKVPDAMGPELFGELKGIVATGLQVPVEQVTDNARFFGKENGGLGADSLDLVKLIIDFEEKTDVQIQDKDEYLLGRVHHMRDYYNIAKLGDNAVLESWRKQREAEIEESKKNK